MKERIFLLIEALGLSARQFSLQIGKSESFARTIRANIGSDVIGDILREFPQTNLYWLITGVGSIFNNIGEDNIQEYSNHNLDEKLSAEALGGHKKEPDYKEKYIVQLEKDNELLVNDNKQKSAIIQGFLEGKISKIG